MRRGRTINPIRSCPFCNTEAYLDNDTGIDDEYYVEFIKCSNMKCGVMMESTGTGDSLISRWNTRTGK